MQPLWRRWLLPLLAAGGCLLPAPPLDAAEAPAGPAPLEEIERVTGERNSRLESLFVRYRMRSMLLGSAEDAKRYLNLYALVDELKTFAFSHKKRYAALKRPTDHYEELAPSVAAEPSGDGPQKEPPQPVKEVHRIHDLVSKAFQKTGTQVPQPQLGVIPVEREVVNRYDGELLSTWYDVDKPRLHLMGAAYTSAQDDDRATFNQLYMWAVFHSIRDAFNERSDRGEHRLPEALSRFAVQLRPALEVVDGAPCAVLELGRQIVLWCDPQLGYAVRRWESLAEDAQHVTDRYELGEHSEIAPALWLPRRLIWTRWAPSSAPEAVRAQPLVQYVFDVQELHANDVPDALFQTDLEAVPAGTLIVDNLNTIKDPDGFELATNYKRPADVAEIDSAVAKAREDMQAEWQKREEKRERDARQQGGGGWSLARLAIIGVNVVIVLALAAIVLRSRWRRRA